MARRRFFVSAFDGPIATLSGEQAYHLGRVLRARPGQLYELSDGKELRVGRVRAVARESVQFDLVEKIPLPEPALEIVLLPAIVKFDRLEWCLEKATELGVTEIRPVEARRSETRLVRAAAKRRARWQRILLEAAQQARLPRIPALAEPTRLARALEAVSAKLKILLLESSDAPPLKSILRSAGKVRRVALAVGPEGGWTADELRAARENGFQAASLGPSILRAETAVLAALAAVNYELS